MTDWRKVPHRRSLKLLAAISIFLASIDFIVILMLIATKG